MRSMTGYGRVQLERDGREMTVEMKSVNHRFLDLSLRLPRHLGFAEDALKRQIGESTKRGHFDVFVTYRNSRADARRVNVDTALAAAYRSAFEALAQATGAENKLTTAQYAALPDVLTVSECEEDQQAVSALLAEVTGLALRQLDEMRLREGAAMKKDLELHLGLLEDLRQRIALRAPEVPKQYRDRLLQRMKELGADGADPVRIAQEVALFADHAAIDEELARLDSHIRQARILFEGEAECGSKLNFLVQEMNREVNTMGSKAMDSDIAALVVEAKSEIEKLREQIQNVE